MRIAVLIVVAALAGAAAAGEAPDVEKIREEYRAIARNQDHDQRRRRRALARQLAERPTEAARELLLEMLADDGCIRVRVEALRSLGAVGDRRAVEKAVLLLNREARTALPEFLGEALARSRDPEVHALIVERLLRHNKEAIQLGAVQAAGALGLPAAREPLLALYERFARRRGKEDLAYELLRALGRIGGEGTAEVLLDAAAARERHLRLAAAEGLLAHHRDAAARAALAKLLADDDAVVRTCAAEAVGAAGADGLAPLLLPYLAAPGLRLQDAAHASLCRLAGADLGPDAAAWSRWCETRALPAEPVTRAAREDVSAIPGDCVLFILDMWHSMRWPEDWGPSRLDVARGELQELIAGLRPPAHFDVLTLSGSVGAWAKKPQAATPKNVERALAWLAKRRTENCTSTITALRKAFEDYPEADTVFLLSDGSMPVGGEYREPEELLAWVRQANRLRRVVLHTRSYMWGRGPERFWKYEDQDDLAELMRRLAEENGGTFTERREPFRGGGR